MISESKPKYSKTCYQILTQDRKKSYTFSSSIVDLEHVGNYETFESFCWKINRNFKVRKYQTPETMIAHLCAYLDF